MSEMVTKVKEALLARRVGYRETDGMKLVVIDVDEAARAAIQAMREPTEAIMVVIEQRAEREGDERYTAGHGDYERRFSPRKLIAAYIDSCLQD